MAVKLGKRHLRLVLGLLVLSAAWNVYRWGFAGRPSAAPPDQTPMLNATTGAAPPVASTRRAPAIDPMKIPAPPPVDLGTEPAWGRDPFLAVGESRHPGVQMAAEAEPALPVVRSILYGPDRRLALLDRRVVRVGDAIGAGVISDIQPNAVIIRTRSGELRRIEVAKPASRPPAVASDGSRSR